MCDSLWQWGEKSKIVKRSAIYFMNASPRLYENPITFIISTLDYVDYVLCSVQYLIMHEKLIALLHSSLDINLIASLRPVA